MDRIGGIDDGRPTRAFDPGVLAVLASEYEAADRARMATERRYTQARDAFGRALAQAGPHVIGLFKYSGLSDRGMGVVFREMAVPVDSSGEAPLGVGACGDYAVFEDDGAIE